MNFKEATDELFAHVDHADLAEALGVSVASIRQARLDPKAKAHRAAPDGWQQAVIRLSKRRASQYQQLINKLRDN